MMPRMEARAEAYTTGATFAMLQPGDYRACYGGDIRDAYRDDPELLADFEAGYAAAAAYLAA